MNLKHWYVCVDLSTCTTPDVQGRHEHLCKSCSDTATLFPEPKGITRADRRWYGGALDDRDLVELLLTLPNGKYRAAVQRCANLLRDIDSENTPRVDEKVSRSCLDCGRRPAPGPSCLWCAGTGRVVKTERLASFSQWRGRPLNQTALKTLARPLPKQLALAVTA